MDWIQIIVLSLIQGVTEFLPISSSGHLILPAQLTDWPDQGLAFDIGVHAGTLFAVLWYFRLTLTEMAVDFARYPANRLYTDQIDLALKIGASTIPHYHRRFLFPRLRRSRAQDRARHCHDNHALRPRPLLG